jgi:hypothetical protein
VVKNLGFAMQLGVVYQYFYANLAIYMNHDGPRWNKFNSPDLSL